MTNKEALEVLKQEWQCIDRNDGMHCNRVCDKCDLVMDTEVLKDAYNMAIKALEEQQWIPVESIDDVPDHEVMCCDKYGEEMFGYLCYNEQWLCESDSTIMYNPIAYREKPEPYKEGE